MIENRRLAADFLTALVRRPTTGLAAVAAWGTLHVPVPTTHDGRVGGAHNLLAAAGWGDTPVNLHGPRSAPLLSQIARVSEAVSSPADCWCHTYAIGISFLTSKCTFRLIYTS